MSRLLLSKLLSVSQRLFKVAENGTEQLPFKGRRGNTELPSEASVSGQTGFPVYKER